MVSTVKSKTAAKSVLKGGELVDQLPRPLKRKRSMNDEKVASVAGSEGDDEADSSRAKPKRKRAKVSGKKGTQMKKIPSKNPKTKPAAKTKSKLGKCIFHCLELSC